MKVGDVVWVVPKPAHWNVLRGKVVQLDDAERVMVRLDGEPGEPFRFSIDAVFSTKQEARAEASRWRCLDALAAGGVVRTKRS
jgi:hypothetical protein